MTLGVNLGCALLITKTQLAVATSSVETSQLDFTQKDTVPAACN
jgi:hypothetical protein